MMACLWIWHRNAERRTIPSVCRMKTIKSKQWNCRALTSNLIQTMVFEWISEFWCMIRSNKRFHNKFKNLFFSFCFTFQNIFKSMMKRFNNFYEYCFEYLFNLNDWSQHVNLETSLRPESSRTNLNSALLVLWWSCWLTSDWWVAPACSVHCSSDLNFEFQEQFTQQRF